MKTLIGIKKIFFETNNILSVFWNPTLFCNYRCSYCSYSKYSDKIDTASFDKYAKFIDRLFSECSRTGKKVLALSMSGGEPTMDPNLIPALNLIREYSLSKYPDIRVWFRINTNMSKPEAFISKFADIILQFDRANVTGSYHKEYVNRDVFLHKMKILHDKGIMCDVNHVMTKQHFYEYYSDAKYFNDNGLNVMLSAERSHSAGKANTEYSDEEKQLLYTQFEHRKNPYAPSRFYSSIPDFALHELSYSNGEIERTKNTNFLLYENIIDFSGWNCAAGRDHIFVDFEKNNIRRGAACGSFSLGNCENFTLLDNMKICEVKKCTCKVENDMTKYKVT